MRLPHLAIIAVLALLPAARVRAADQDSWDRQTRVVAVGDVHGDYGQLVTVLQDAGVVDAKLHWTGGRAHLVQTGDRLDRGPDSRRVMDLFIRLAKEAKKAGGVVHALTGNHEAMNVLGDTRYVTPEEFAAFKSPDSARLRDALWADFVRETAGRGEAPKDDQARQRFDAEHPLGWVEHRLAFSSRGTYGAWIARQNAVIRIGDSLFLHGGLGPKYADFGLRDLNERIAQELEDGDPRAALVSLDPEGPLWYRGLAEGDPALGAHLDAVLKKHGVRRIVIGHTRTEGLVLPRYGGRVILIDVGLAKVYGGPPAALLLEDGRPVALHRGTRLPLPEENGEPLVRYVRQVMALEPDPARLKPLLDKLEASISAAAVQH